MRALSYQFAAAKTFLVNPTMFKPQADKAAFARIRMSLDEASLKIQSAPDKPKAGRNNFKELPLECESAWPPANALGAS